jgi:putative cell wall-binding protein
MVVLSSAPAAAARVGGGRVAANTLLGVDTVGARGRGLPGLAADPADPDHVVEVEEDLTSGRCSFETTFDGGSTWAGGDLTAPPDFPQPPCPPLDSTGYGHSNQSVEFGSGQNVYTTFSARRGSQGDSVLVSRSADGGRTFSTAVVALAGSAASQPSFVRPQLAVEAGGGGDRVHVSTWGVHVTSGDARSGGGERRLVTTRSDDGGDTWTPPVDAQGPGEVVADPTQPAVGRDGALYVGWRARGPDAPDHVVVARSIDAGATWRRSQAGEVSTNPGAGGEAGSPHLAASQRSDDVYVVYPGRQAGDPAILLQRSPDGGATWSSPVRVDDGRGGPTAGRAAPQVSLAPDGRVDVVWMDRRADHGRRPGPRSPGVGDVWYSSSTDGGRTFSANRRVTDRSIDLGAGLRGGPGVGSAAWYAPAVAALGDDRLLFAWGDSRLGGADVFTAAMDLNPTTLAPVRTLPNDGPAGLAVGLSRLAYPGGAVEPGDKPTAKVVVVNQNDAASAIVGASLAHANSGPLLVTGASDLNRATREEVSRLRPGGAFVIGPPSLVSDKVLSSLAAAGAQGPERVNGSDGTDTARRVALVLDPRDAAARSEGSPAFEAVVVVNPDSGDAPVGSALAATLGVPVLLTSRDAVPPATADALRQLAVATTLVVGGATSVGDPVLGNLPGAKRLGGADPTLTSEAVVAEARARGVAPNVVYVTDGERPVDQAVAGAAAARTGGVLLAERRGGVTAARRSIDKVGLTSLVDQLVVARTRTPAGASTALLVILGLVILALGAAAPVIALAKRERAPTGGADAPAPSRRHSMPCSRA